MPRLPLIRTQKYPYHVTARSNNREWFYLPIDEVWKIFLQSLQTAQKNNNVIIHNFVLMNNHYHLLVRTPDENLDSFQWEFAQHFTRHVRASSQRINHVFGGRYKWSLITEESYFFHVYKYIYLNPVKAGLVKSFSNYPYSSWHMVNQDKCQSVALDDIIVKRYDLQRVKQWVNQGYTDEESLSLGKGLRKREFEFSKKRNDRRAPSFKITL